MNTYTVRYQLENDARGSLSTLAISREAAIQSVVNTLNAQGTSWRWVTEGN